LRSLAAEAALAFEEQRLRGSECEIEHEFLAAGMGVERAAGVAGEIPIVEHDTRVALCGLREAEA